MKYPMRLDRLSRPVLWLFGATQDASFVEVTDEAVLFRFGAFRETVPLSETASVDHAKWSWIGGVGWRIGLGGTIGLIGSLSGVVELRLRAPRRVWVLFVPWRCQRICVSLCDPEGFLADVRGRLGANRHDTDDRRS